MMRVTRTSTLPVDACAFSATDLFDHLRVESWAHVEAVRQGNAATVEIENYGSLALLTQTVRVTLPAWTGDPLLHLPVGPVIDDEGATVMVGGAAFTGFYILPSIRPVLQFSEDPPEGQIIIEYQAGFGPSADSVPADLRHAIMDQAAAFYDVRGSLDQRGAAQSQMTGLSPHAARIVARYRGVGL